MARTPRRKKTDDETPEPESAEMTPPVPEAESGPQSAEMTPPSSSETPEPQEAPPTVEVQPVAGQGMVTILPRKTESRVRIGKKWYSFKQGVAVRVPAESVEHLKRCGFV